MNGYTKDYIIDIIEGRTNASTDEKLTLLMKLVLDAGDAIAATRAGNPLEIIPLKWRPKILGALFTWFIWATVNLSGYPITIPAVLGWFKGLK